MRRHKKIMVLIIGALIMTQAYQNCGQLGQFEATSDFASLSMGDAGSQDMNHPAPDKTLPSQKLQVANRRYAADLLREVFTSTTTPVPSLEAHIHAWILNKGGQFGLGCDPYSTYSGRDCGGDMTNANIGYNVGSNTVRESFHIQFCETVLGADQAVFAVLEKIKNRSTAPTGEAVRQIYGFFYRGEEASDLLINSLLDLDRSLAQNNEAVTDRWRAIILQVCESPGWQLL